MSDALRNVFLEPWDQLVADNIKEEMTRSRWTGRKAAAALGLTPTYVSRRLRGETVISPTDLKMFADLLGVPVQRFFEMPDYRSLGIPPAPSADRGTSD